MCVYVCMWGSFDNCVDVLVICLFVFTVFLILCTAFFVLFLLCIFILNCFVCTSVRKSKHILCTITLIFNCAVYEKMSKNNVERGRPQVTIWLMRIACWIHKTTNTHSECVILIAFPQQQWLHERASVLHFTYITCPVSNRSVSAFLRQGAGVHPFKDSHRRYSGRFGCLRRKPIVWRGPCIVLAILSNVRKNVNIA